MEWFEHDPPFFKLFHLIQVNEPSIEEALAILRQIREAYEQHYKLEITDDALQAAVHLSAKFLPDLALPNKAIDLIDAAAVQVRLNAAHKRYLEDQTNQDNSGLGQTPLTHPESAAAFKINPHVEIKGFSVTEHDVAEVVAKWIEKPLADILYE